MRQQLIDRNECLARQDNALAMVDLGFEFVLPGRVQGRHNRRVTILRCGVFRARIISRVAWHHNSRIMSTRLWERVAKVVYYRRPIELTASDSSDRGFSQSQTNRYRATVLEMDRSPMPAATQPRLGRARTLETHPRHAATPACLLGVSHRARERSILQSSCKFERNSPVPHPQMACSSASEPYSSRRIAQQLTTHIGGYIQPTAKANRSFAINSITYSRNNPRIDFVGSSSVRSPTRFCTCSGLNTLCA